MKQKCTLNIADVQLNVLVDMSAEEAERISRILDRRMREFFLRSRHCTKNEAALLCALEFCFERLELQSKNESLEALNAKYEEVLKVLRDRNEYLNQELENVKSENKLLRSLITAKTADAADIVAAMATEAEEPVEDEAPETTAQISASDFFTEVAAAAEGNHAADDTDDDDDSQTAPSLIEGLPTRAQNSATAKADDETRRRRRGAMFDLLSFDQD